MGSSRSPWHVGRLLDGCRGPVPCELVKDGDLLLLIDRMLCLRGPGTVRTSKVQGHADEAMVLNGQVREVDRLGNNAADEAAGFGCRRVSPAVIDARRNLSGVCGRWSLFILDLHRFFIAIARVMVEVVLLLTLLSGLLVLFIRDEGWSMRFGTVHFCLGLLVFGALSGFRFLLLVSALRMLLFGLTLLVSWSSGSLS